MVTQGNGIRRRTLTGLAAGAVAILLAVGASPAAASVTIGQLAPAGGSNPCTPNHDVVPVATPGANYVVPNDGTIISWSTQANAAPNGLMGMKIFRKIAEPDLYLIVGREGPRTLAPGVLNTFPANIPVKRNDLLGIVLPNPNNGSGCLFPQNGDLFRFNNTNLGNGATGNLTFTEANVRLNITALFNPTNSFTIGKQTANKKKGSATLEVTVPNPGVITVEGNGVKPAARAVKSVAVQAGVVPLLIKAQGKKKKKLNTKRKVRVTPKLIYTPTGGDPFAQTAKVTLKKKRSKKKR